MRKRKVLKKILIVNTSARRCGVDVYCLRIHGLFVESADFVFVAKTNSDFEGEISGRKIPFYSFGGNLLSEAWLFRKILRSEKPDIVHIQTARDYHLAFFKSWFPRISFVITRHNSLPLARFPNRFFLRQADRIVAVSKDSRNALLEKFPDLGSKTAVIHHGMEIGKTMPFPLGKTLRVGYLGRISKTKGLHTLIAALGLLKNRNPRLSFLLDIGGFFEDLEYKESIRRLIKKLRLQGEIRFSGVIRDSKKFLKQTHVLVQPAPLSARESFGLVALEAMSVGRPVVAFACGALPELI
ncbi:MAG: glycosyltransferase family 4 protein, partial [Spirochaetia bacterium]|nr:glycosyltransferase family 4 protein [Spirochaetia bacterium]